MNDNRATVMTLISKCFLMKNFIFVIRTLNLYNFSFIIDENQVKAYMNSLGQNDSKNIVSFIS